MTTRTADLTFNYLLELGELGFLVMDLMGSYLLEARFADPFVDFDCTGYFGCTCGLPSPIWRHQFRATWESYSIYDPLGRYVFGSVQFNF